LELIFSSSSTATPRNVIRFYDRTLTHNIRIHQPFLRLSSHFCIIAALVWRFAKTLSNICITFHSHHGHSTLSSYVISALLYPITYPLVSGTILCSTMHSHCLFFVAAFFFQTRTAQCSHSLRKTPRFCTCRTYLWKHTPKCGHYCTTRFDTYVIRKNLKVSYRPFESSAKIASFNSSSGASSFRSTRSNSWINKKKCR